MCLLLVLMRRFFEGWGVFIELCNKVEEGVERDYFYFGLCFEIVRRRVWKRGKSF